MKYAFCLSTLIFFSGCAVVDLENEKYFVGGDMPNEETISKRAINAMPIPLSKDIHSAFYDLDGDFEHEYAFAKLKCGRDLLTYAASEMSTKRYLIDNKDENENSKPDGVIDEIIPLAEVDDIRTYVNDIRKYVIGCDKPYPNLPDI